MTVTLRNSRDAEDIHLQNNFWIQLREIIAFCQRFAYVFRYHPCHLLGTDFSKITYLFFGSEVSKHGHRFSDRNDGT
jgi:hypothetical protein